MRDESRTGRRQILRLGAAAAVGPMVLPRWARAADARNGALRATVPMRAVTRGPKHHFFGYYDKFPWDASGRYLLAMEIDFADRQPKPGEALTVGMIDLQDDNRFIPLDKTLAWCWQQGTMLQWLEPKHDREVIYNAFADGDYVSIILDVHSGKTRTLPRPVYAINRAGTQAVTLDFDRVNRLRPGYGYVMYPDRRADVPAPADAGIYVMDLATGENRLAISIEQAANNQPDDRFTNAEHWFNHLQFNPLGTRFLFLHRWNQKGKGWYTRLYSAKPDGGDIRLHSDNNVVSHFDWRDDDTILAWAAREPRVYRFCLFDVNGGETQTVGECVLKQDGHCSYSPDRRWLLVDTYPDKQRFQRLMLYPTPPGGTAGDETPEPIEIGSFHEPSEFKGPWRCDLHPRWNRDGTRVCIDSTHDGTRQMYVLDVAKVVK